MSCPHMPSVTLGMVGKTDGRWSVRPMPSPCSMRYRRRLHQSGLCSLGVCQAPSCADRVRNGLESDIDCGGVCDACPLLSACVNGQDCQSGTCFNNQCRQPSCEDQIRNGAETDIDCGGPQCAACDEVQSVECQPIASVRGAPTVVVMVPTCFDRIQNGDEINIDCGGSCDACRECIADEECIVGQCLDNQCRLPSCDDNLQNGAETGIDCGGPCRVVWRRQGALSTKTA